jgi:hypothetical protein
MAAAAAAAALDPGDSPCLHPLITSRAFMIGLLYARWLQVYQRPGRIKVEKDHD